MDKVILVVEDDDAILQSLSEILIDEGYGTARARNGLEALAYLRTHSRPDLILLDVMMPGMSGLELRRVLACDPALASIPVIALTAGAPDGQWRGLELAHFMRKPVDLDLLLAAIADICRGSGTPGCGSTSARRHGV